MVELKWRIYYGDGRTADNRTTLMADLSRWNVQIILQRDSKHNRAVTSGKDYYVYLSDCDYWFGVNLQGLWDYLAHKCTEVEAVLFGRYIANEIFDEIERIASKDVDFLKISAGRGRFKE
jgi:hypothetical protein